MKFFYFFIFVVLSFSCVSNKGVINYVDPTSIDDSMSFNSTDLQTITQKMVSGMLSSNAIANITDDGTRPIIMFSNIKNETSEFINTNMIANTISTEIINSGKFRFTDMGQIEEMKKQINYQKDSGMIDNDTAVKMGHQLGAQYILYGSIIDIQTSNKKQYSLFYLITLKMINLESGLIIWQDQKKIRKVQKRNLIGW